jgi:hypothetical protein
MLKYVLAGTITALAFVATAPAKGAEPAAPAAPEELSQYDFFVGTWHCTGTAFASPMMAEHATTATVHVNKAVGGRWIHATYDENKTPANSKPYHAALFWGYDSGKKTFVQDCVDSMGGYCSATGAGWKGDTFVFEGSSRGYGDESGARDTFAKKGPDGLTHTGEMQGPDKKWVKTDEEACHRHK